MSTMVQKKIINNLQNLNTFQLSETLDFINFITRRSKKELSDLSIIECLCGKYKSDISSSEKFSKHKNKEIELEDSKWIRK